jgi:CheY-like chemotaxis protein
MDDETLARATEPFFTTKGPGKGTGLGLSMVHGLAAQSGGALSISSEPNKGTRVILWLPRAELGLAEQSAAGGAQQSLLDGEPKNVLIVDDDPLVCTGTVAMLEDLGHMVIEANSGIEALKVLRTNSEIDLVITDHAMPGMTGTELARQIRGIYPKLAVLLATGYAELPEGVDDLGLPRLSKPYRQEDLAVAIANAGQGQPNGDARALRAG